MQPRRNIQTAGYILQLAVVLIALGVGLMLTFSNPDGKPGFGRMEWFGVILLAYGVLRAVRLYQSWKKGRSI